MHVVRPMMAGASVDILKFTENLKETQEEEIRTYCQSSTSKLFSAWIMRCFHNIFSWNSIK